MDPAVFHDADAEDKRPTVALAFLGQNVIAESIAFVTQLKHHRIIVDLCQLLILEFASNHAFIIFAFRCESGNKGDN
ncbi:MAG: hypothetical protein ABF291_14895 [Desulfobacterales bacterium]